MNRAYYSASVQKFLGDDSDLILGELARNHPFALEDLQKNSWISQITILKSILHDLPESYIAFEYSIPRMGKRVDTIILYRGMVFVLEFKVGMNIYSHSACDQVLDYAIDLKNFHEQSHCRDVVPIVVATEAPEEPLHVKKYPDNVYFPIMANKTNVALIINRIASSSALMDQLDPRVWMESIYKPTPTIIEAAQALYKGHSVKEISRSDSGAINLTATSEAVAKIIDYSKRCNRKSICFITGVPGAGKTLAGLNIANERHNTDKGEHAVFLSGNGPLVAVLQEALARNEVEEKKGSAEPITKSQSLARTRAFIQNIHHFRDDALQNPLPPIEKVVVFDEAQRAWTLEQTRSFMTRKKGMPDFDMSEPEFLISVLDRHQDWAIIVCLIGGGQEINTGEAGLPEWFSAIQKKYGHWDVYVSDKLSDKEYTNGIDRCNTFQPHQLSIKNELHLSVSVRSYRSEKLSEFVESFLNLDVSKATTIYSQIKDVYPIVLTRDLKKAKDWVRSKSRGGEGYGIIASSGAYRLKPYGIHVNSDIEPKTWFLNEKSDIRSSSFLEDVATEFEIQGLELDWTCVAWDANLRKNDMSWEYKNFRGTEWQNINDTNRKRYLLNTYRVLLTRARQGMIIFIPEGDASDRTRLPEFYDPVYQYFMLCGVPTI
jgi:hypothetical protein